jgi:hypothetical protein
MLIEKILRSIYHPFISRYKTWNQGAKGEELVEKWLVSLGDGYFILKDVMLPDKKGNIDHIVLGKNGIFVIETKTHKGFIACDGDIWTQVKGPRGSSYRGNIGSPSKQVKGNILALRKFFEQYYPKLSGIWIHGIVVFANEESMVKVRNPTVLVFNKPSQLIDFIKTREGSFNINIEDYHQIEEILESKKKNKLFALY